MDGVPTRSPTAHTQIYPLDAVYDTPDDVPEAVKTNKRYANVAGYTIKEVAEQVRGCESLPACLPA